MTDHQVRLICFQECQLSSAPFTSDKILRCENFLLYDPLFNERIRPWVDSHAAGF
jgi:hypothetical protein